MLTSLDRLKIREYVESRPGVDPHQATRYYSEHGNFRGFPTKDTPERRLERMKPSENERKLIENYKERTGKLDDKALKYLQDLRKAREEAQKVRELQRRERIQRVPPGDLVNPGQARRIKRREKRAHAPFRVTMVEEPEDFPEDYDVDMGGL